MKKLLVGIDDSKVNIAIYEQAAEIFGADIITAENGRIALDKIMETIKQGRVPDLVFVDINMPIMDGLEFIEEAKKNSETKYIPVIVITTEREMEKKIKGKNLGAAGWIVKPVSPEMVVTIAKKFLRM